MNSCSVKLLRSVLLATTLCAGAGCATVATPVDRPNEKISSQELVIRATRLLKDMEQLGRQFELKEQINDSIHLVSACVPQGCVPPDHPNFGGPHPKVGVDPFLVGKSIDFMGALGQLKIPAADFQNAQLSITQER